MSWALCIDISYPNPFEILQITWWSVVNFFFFLHWFTAPHIRTIGSICVQQIEERFLVTGKLKLEWYILQVVPVEYTLKHEQLFALKFQFLFIYHIFIRVPRLHSFNPGKVHSMNTECAYVNTVNIV